MKLQHEIRRLKKRNGNNDEKCAICLSNPYEMLFQPCGHVCCCSDCSRILLDKWRPKCPICRKAVENAQKIYLS